ncbi:polysaccharide pyruvyl transferase family protein [Mesorhizobium sp. SP-1A]|uniref:polysaccharide pyruvyl transferase family protein n=1 Tax=Mesorhizobium sp. SP-1A TaxID=3077840 RepID=UPI0028F71768|nr:polysaccharide pyruvyl transferase family protein [Mesorhizobium sp. SP-1A]
MTTSWKIGILTFHRCINYGSYWQARCLVEGLRAMGHDAVLLDHDSASVNRLEWRCALDPQRPAKAPAGDRARYAKKTRRFFAALQELPRSIQFELEDPCSLGDLDIIVVGSDEVWNLCHPWYGRHAIFYGSGLKAGRLVSYAASFGNQRFSDGLPALWADSLSNFFLVSVRDDNSARLVRDATGREPELVLDPCLQFPSPIERIETATAGCPYAVVYGHTFPRWFADAVRSWATATGHRLLSVGYRNDWADEQLIAVGPRRFAQLVAGSAAVATNFFHGCIFALLNAKPFVCVSSPYRANKLAGLMQLVSAENHLVAEDVKPALMRRLLEGLPEDGIAARIAELRQRSHDFLEKAVA